MVCDILHVGYNTNLLVGYRKVIIMRQWVTHNTQYNNLAAFHDYGTHS